MLGLKLAIRGLWRHKVRTAITLTALSMGHCMGMIFVSMNDGGHELMIELGVRQGRAGHLVVQAEGYQKSQSVELLVDRPATVRETLQRALPEARVALRAFGGGLARTAADSVGVLFSGVEPRVERRVNDLADRIERGVFLGADALEVERAEQKLKKNGALWCARPPGAEDPPRRQALVGAELARTLKIDLCDGLIIDAQGLGSRESVRFLVVGIFRWNSPDLDASFVTLDLSDVQQMLHIGSGVHQVAVFLPSVKSTADALRRVEGRILDPALAVLSWDKAMPEMAEFIWLDEASGYVFLVIVYLIIGIGILNTILMSVMERTREIGVIRALGAGPWRIVRLVLSEGLALGVLGVTIGSLGAIYPCWYLETTGIDMSQFSDAAMEMGGLALTVVKGKLYLSSALWATAGVVLMAVLAAVYPAVRAAKLQVLRAIHQA
ncbi:MAG: FtsX-like permease family protein [Polyangia bacterium]|jgi:ABC-type lipoprotein release transport system permease subunit|nr:FtsX-like permease family protein [Polyangia bacterium]